MNFLKKRLLPLLIVAGVDLGILEWWGCDSSACKNSSHAHLMKTTPILIVTGSPLHCTALVTGTQVQNLRLHHSLFRVWFITCSELNSVTTMLIAT